MAKALREMSVYASDVDCIVYVLDARIPLSSINKEYDRIFANKPRLYVLNKADLVPPDELSKWKKYYSAQAKCVTSDSTVNAGAQKFVSALREVNAEKIERYKNRGVKKTVRAMVVGIPNCGKSTLINSLVAKKRAKTGNRPGVTRAPQWVSIDEYVDLLDTPGTLYPDFSDAKKAVKLAAVGSIKDTVIDNTELALEILGFLKNEHADALRARYSLTEIPDGGLELLEAVARRKGCLLRGGDIDSERAATAVIQDFRKQAFGKIILEKA
jgi:ribosome biogenesis GTPase A